MFESDTKENYSNSIAFHTHACAPRAPTVGLRLGVRTQFSITCVTSLGSRTRRPHRLYFVAHCSSVGPSLTSLVGCEGAPFWGRASQPSHHVVVWILIFLSHMYTVVEYAPASNLLMSCSPRRLCCCTLMRISCRRRGCTCSWSPCRHLITAHARMSGFSPTRVCAAFPTGLYS